MKKTLIYTFILLILPEWTFAQDSKILFSNFSNVEEVEAAATAQGKKIYVNLHYQGCGFCLKLEKETFTDQRVGEYYNDNFISLSLDINKDPLGRYYKTKYSVRSFPAHLFFDENGDLQHMVSAFMIPGQFINLAKEAYNNDKNFAYYRDKVFNEGDLSAETLRKLFNISRISERDSLINLYLNNLAPEDRYSVDTWFLLSENTSNYRSNYFKYIVDNEAKFRSSVGDKAVDDYLINHWSFMIDQWTSWAGNDFQRTKARKEFRKLNHPLTERIIDRVNYNLAINRVRKKNNSKKNWEQIITLSQNYLNKDYDDWYHYHRASWVILSNYKKYNNPDENLNLAIKLAQRSIAEHKEFINLFIYSLILNENKNLAVAQIVMKEAMSYADDRVEERYLEIANQIITSPSSP